MKRGASWTSSDDVRQQILQRWDRGQLLSAKLLNEPLFPLRLPLRRPESRDLLDRFDDVRTWIRELEAGSAEERGFGYQLEWDEVRHRQLGTNKVPRVAVFAEESDALRLIARTRESQRFSALAEETVRDFPMLREWLARRPMLALERTDEWPRVLAVLHWFRKHPRSGLYLRQVDPPGVDSKFIERNKGLLGELLDRVLPAEHIDSTASGASGFERRYGLRTRPVQLRLRMLDPALSVRGITDLAAPVEQVAALELRPRRVFVTENDTNAIAFPEVRDAIVVFGKGYALDALADVGWIREAELHYWGDIDTHGFAILDRLRSASPDARSLLMDEATLLAHRHAWTQEGTDQRCARSLMRLTPTELALYDLLREDKLGPAVRLEQERIGFGCLRKALAEL